MKCFYHSSDLDGKCSAAIVKWNNPEIELFPINYGDKFPWEDIKENETVYMVDFGLQPFDDMEKLNKICNFIWIDHHKTAIDEAYKRKFFACGGQSLEIGKAACELVWDWFEYYESTNNFVHLMGRYDVWDLIPGTLELQQGLKLYDTNPKNDEIWIKICLDDPSFLEECLKNGKLLLRKQKIENKEFAEAYSFETSIDGLDVIALNVGRANSKIFEDVYNPKYHDAMLAFCWYDGKWTVSLYSDKKNVDVGIVCKNRGGGGHMGAAGFQCENLPFKLTMNKKEK